MFFIIPKLTERIKELQQYRFIEMQSLFPMQGALGDPDPSAPNRVVPESFGDFEVSAGFTITGRDRYFWTHKTVTLPEPREDCDVCGFFVMGQYGHLIGAESMCFINKGLYQGVDQNHEEVVLNAFAGQTVDIDILTWTGMEGKEPPLFVENRVVKAEVGYLWKPADDLYFALKAAQQTLEVLKEYDGQRALLEELVEETLCLLNWDKDKIMDTIPVALAYFLEHIGGMQKLPGATVDVSGATHIDLAWVWRIKHTREKAMRSFSTVMRLMEEFPEYTFMQSTPQLYKYIKEDNPDLYEQIKARIREGRWEAEGGMWLEADCNLSSGESLVRQFLHGMNFFKDEFGVRCTYLWLPDVFGYSWSLPQILKGCGIKTFATNKISWNQFNTMPHDLFSWRGIDGTDIMTYLLTSPGDMDDGQGNIPEPMPAETLEQKVAKRGASYNTCLTAKVELATWMRFREKKYTQTAFIPYGHGDGGGGTTRGMIKTRRMLDKMPGLPTVRNAHIGEFFDNMHADVAKSGKKLPVWDGELYLEYHRGTYTTQANNKKYNRKLEYKLAETEWLSANAALQGGSYPDQALENGWEVVLRNQFHDIIPGSGIPEIYEESCAEYKALDEQLDELQQQAMDQLTESVDGFWTVMNSSSFATRAEVLIPETAVGRFVDETGAPLQAQRVAEGYLVSVDVPALGFAAIGFEAGSGAATAAATAAAVEAPLSVITENAVESDSYILSWDETGALTRVYDKLADREVLAGRGNILQVFEDKPMRYDAWDIDIYYMLKQEAFVQTAPVKVLENGPLTTVLEFTYGYNQSQIVQKLTLHKDSARIDFVTDVDWQEDHRLLKAAFEVDIRSTKASYDIQYGYVERPTHYNTSWDYARFEVCGHKWSDLSESDYGVSLLTDCKYGYSTHENVMTVSLLKSPKAPDRWADMGHHQFTYSLYPHQGSLAMGGTIEAATALNQPLKVFSGKMAADSLFQVSGTGINVDCCKLSWDKQGYILRIHETRGGRSRFSITTRLPMTSCQPCNLIEELVVASPEMVSPEVVSDTNTVSNTVEGELKAFEIRTYRINF